MARKPITISVPEWLQLYIEDRVKGGGYGSVSEYFRELLRGDMQGQVDRIDRAGRAGSISERKFQLLASAARRAR